MPVSETGTACAPAGRPAPSSRPKRSRPVPVRSAVVEDRALGVEVAKPGAGPVAGERRVPCGGADLVGPLPSDLDGMIGAVACAQHERGRGDLRRREGAVRRHHRGDVAQRGTQLFGEALRARSPGSAAARRSRIIRCSGAGAGLTRRTSRSRRRLRIVEPVSPSSRSAHTTPCPLEPRNSSGSRPSASSPSTWRTALTSDP